MNFRVTLVVLACVLLGAPEAAKAGMLTSGGVHWRTFSFEPVEKEPTPNYYGYGLDLAFGYSFAQIVDVNAFATYTPAQLKNAEFAADNAKLIGYGARLGLRFLETIFLGFNAGNYTYKLDEQSRDEEVIGKYSGIGGEAILGAIFAVNKTHFWQLGMGYGVVSAKPGKGAADGESDTRKIDLFSVSLAFIYNGVGQGAASDGIFRDFFNSLRF